MSASDFEAIFSEELIAKMTERLSDDEFFENSVGYATGCMDAFTLACKILRQEEQNNPDPMTP